jgi:hypothetical protein
MDYTHSHRCWVGIAPVRGVETHQRWDAVRQDGGRADLRLVEERAPGPWRRRDPGPAPGRA